MSTLTRTQIAANIRDSLLSGRKITPKEFDDILRKAGNHERSRVLTLLRNDWGIPVEQFKTGAYHVTERDLEAYHSDKDETLKIWRTNARYVKTLRKVNITLSLLRGLVGKVPEDTLRTVYKGIETKYLWLTKQKADFARVGFEAIEIYELYPWYYTIKTRVYPQNHKP